MRAKAEAIDRAFSRTFHVPKWAAWIVTGTLISTAIGVSIVRWQALQAAAIQLAVINSSPKFTTDAHGFITSWNQHMVEQTGYTADYMVGRQFFKICDPEWLDKFGSRPVMDTIGDPANIGRPVSVRPRIIKEDGSLRYVWLNVLVQGEGPERVASVTIVKKPKVETGGIAQAAQP